MNISKYKPVKIGSRYIVRINEFPKSIYLGLTSKNKVVGVDISLATVLSTLQEVIDLSYAHHLDIVYDK
jgi:hypothetical protein